MIVHLFLRKSRREASSRWQAMGLNELPRQGKSCFCTDGKISVTINLPLFSTVVPSIICMLLSCRPFEDNVDNVVITTKGLQDRNTHIIDGTTVKNKGKLILTNQYSLIFLAYIIKKLLDDNHHINYNNNKRNNIQSNLQKNKKENNLTNLHNLKTLSPKLSTQNKILHFSNSSGGSQNKYNQQGPDFDDKSSFFPCEIQDAIQYINHGYGAQAPKIVIL